MKKLLSIVVPIYGDGTLVPVFYKAVLEANIQCALEFIFVCDGGGLDEEAFMKAFAERQSNVRGVILSRNFGQHIALSAGYKEAKGDFVCMMNVDLQDPPSEINKLTPADVYFGRDKEILRKREFTKQKTIKMRRKLYEEQKLKLSLKFKLEKSRLVRRRTFIKIWIS